MIYDLKNGKLEFTATNERVILTVDDEIFMDLPRQVASTKPIVKWFINESIVRG